MVVEATWITFEQQQQQHTHTMSERKSKSKSSSSSGSATQKGSKSNSNKEKKMLPQPVPGASPKKDQSEMDTSADEEHKPAQPDGKDSKQTTALQANPAAGERDWTAGFAEGDINVFLSRVYKWRLVVNITDPRVDLCFTVDEPGKQQANKRRKGGSTRVYDADMKFVNCKFTKDKEGGWQAQLVFPLSDVMTAQLGLGSWAEDPKNRGRLYMKKNFKEAEKTICLSAQGFKGVEVDEQGRNKMWLKAAEVDKKMAEQLVLFLLEERSDLCQKYVDEAYETTLASEAAQLKMKYDTSINIWENQVSDKKMSNEEYKVEIAKARKHFMIGPDDQVDMEALNEKLPMAKVVEKFMKDHYTPQIKKRKSDGMEYMAFTAKVFRYATDKELKDGPVFPNELCKKVFDESAKHGKRPMVYNNHKWDFMSQWGKKKDKDEEKKEVDAKQREADMLKDFDRPLDPYTKVALVYTLKIFVSENVSKRVGFHRNFDTIIHYRNPTTEEISRAKAAQSSRISDADKWVVPDAEAHCLTDLSTKVG